MDLEKYSFPPQRLPFRSKTKKWRMKHLDWAKDRSFVYDSVVRASVIHKKINYDLLNNTIHMDDLITTLNPDCEKSDYNTKVIQHYPIINKKIELLVGEEIQRPFDYRIIVTNPEAISDKEEKKQQALYEQLMALIENQNLSDDQYQIEVQKLQDYFQYSWQDSKEMAANALMTHYESEQSFDYKFQRGFFDGLTVAEEYYQVGLDHDEPFLRNLKPLHLSAYRTGYSPDIEDADIVVYEDYCSPAYIIDHYSDYLTPQQIDDIETMSTKTTAKSSSESDGDRALRQALVLNTDVYKNRRLFTDGMTINGVHYDESLLPYDMHGNVRVLQMFWKSWRKLKIVTTYDPQTGQKIEKFRTEDYVINEDLGEEERIRWVSQAWEGTLIGNDIYIKMQPMPVQYRKINNPSDCHFGIIGSIYSLADNKPLSMVDLLKQYAYQYDVIEDKLNRLIYENIGKAVQIDTALLPTEKDGWGPDKWLHFLKKNHIAFTNSFNVANEGPMTGKSAGQNAVATTALDLDLSPIITQYIQLLQFIDNEISEISGISKQREANVGTRETVGGVERSILQSNAITEWMFSIHENIKKRALTAFLQMSKLALRGKSKKFQYLLTDTMLASMNIDGEEYCEADYGLLVDNSQQSKLFDQHLETYVQAALQNNLIDMSTVAYMYTNASRAEKLRMLQIKENEAKRSAAESAQQQQQLEQAKVQQEAEAAQQEMELQRYKIDKDAETRILVAEINAEATKSLNDSWGPKNEIDRQKLMADMQRSDKELQLQIKQYELERQKAKDDKEVALKKIATDKEVKLKQINKSSSTK